MNDYIEYLERCREVGHKEPLTEAEFYDQLQDELEVR